jgi:hypothetical protein
MHGAIVDLDRSRAAGQARPLDRVAIPVLLCAAAAFALAVLGARPASRPASELTDTPVAFPAMAPVSANVPRGVILRPLQLPARYTGVDLAALPDRLANEAPLWTLRSVVVVRGTPGMASVEGPAMIAWTENGIAYSLRSPTRSTTELIAIADELR